MPYIKSEQKIELAYRDHQHAKTPAELNYLISKLCKEYFKNKGICYATCNDIVGALECAKLEFYRHLIGPYEEEKLEQNGDI